MHPMISYNTHSRTSNISHNCILVVAEAAEDLREESLGGVSVVGGQQPAQPPAEPPEQLPQPLLPPAPEQEVSHPLAETHVLRRFRIVLKGSKVFLVIYHEVGGLADDDPHDVAGVGVEGGEGLLLHEAGAHPGPGPELRRLAQAEGAGQRRVREEVELEEAVHLLEHRRAHGPHLHPGTHLTQALCTELSLYLLTTYCHGRHRNRKTVSDDIIVHWRTLHSPLLYVSSIYPS